MQFTGIDDFDAQLKTFLNTLISEISEAEKSALADAQDALKRHIVKDVYEAYSPTVYKRRSKNSSLGTPLSDMDAYSTVIEPAGGNVNGNLQVTSRLVYNPQGGHKVQKWHDQDYNSLIGRIEKKSPAYTWGNDIVPERPFWQEFISEMIDQKELERAFVWALSANEPTVIADGKILEEAHDREY